MFVSMFAIDPLAIVAIVAGLLSFAFLLVGLAFVRKRRALGATLGLLVATLLLSLAALFATFAVATQGYRALTREQIAVLVATEPVGEQQFSARFVFPDGREETFTLAGDELYVDAYILKWKPLLNLLGFHTTYELDRVAGRYSDLARIWTKSAPSPEPSTRWRRPSRSTSSTCGVAIRRSSLRSSTPSTDPPPSSRSKKPRSSRCASRRAVSSSGSDRRAAAERH
jgi:hypothetical protein